MNPALAPQLGGLAGTGDTLDRRRFARVADLIRERAGIRLADTKIVLLEGRLRRRASALGFATVVDYCDYLLDGGAGEDETERLINAVTTNKTDFFREQVHFDYLAGVVLPQLAERRESRLRFWSAACSTGAEPYTLAMVLAENRALNPASGFTILATDIDTDVLATARRAIYPAAMADPIAPVLRARYLMEARDRTRGEFRIVPELRAMVHFAQMNLMDASYAVGEPMHAIFCRNVLIYFDRETQEQVVRRLVDQLVPGGHLFLGHSETVSHTRLGLRPLGNTVFVKD